MANAAAASPAWRKRLSSAVAVLCLPALGLWVHLTIGWPALLAPWATLTAVDGAILGVGITLSYLARAARLYDYFHAFAGPFPLATLRLSLLHNLANNLLPMRTGEAAFPLLMKRYFGASYLEAGLSLLWLRMLDLATLVLLTSLVIALAEVGPGRHLGLATALVSGVSIASLPWLVRRLPQDAEGGRLQRLVHAVVQSLPDRPSAYLRAVLYTVAAWGAKGLALVWLILSFTELGAADGALGVAAGELSSVLPIHGVAGSGTYEAAMVGALVTVGSAHDVALLAAVNVHLLLLATALLLGVGALLLPRPAPSGHTDRVS